MSASGVGRDDVPRGVGRAAGARPALAGLRDLDAAHRRAGGNADRRRLGRRRHRRRGLVPARRHRPAGHRQVRHLDQALPVRPGRRRAGRRRLGPRRHATTSASSGPARWLLRSGRPGRPRRQDVPVRRARATARWSGPGRAAGSASAWCAGGPGCCAAASPPGAAQLQVPRTASPVTVRSSVTGTATARTSIGVERDRQLAAARPGGRPVRPRSSCRTARAADRPVRR